ncbi:MAG: hypothetical protein K2X39_01035 [Silvanigrellaceae bacterium]|nr:hypothetical protein [Silvanigrellaceae bacterium]
MDEKFYLKNPEFDDKEFLESEQSCLEYSNNDDDNNLSYVQKNLEIVLSSINRIGGEVCRLRAEMDGLLEQNTIIVEAYNKLRSVIEEKKILNIDDFDLACDVFEEHDRSVQTPRKNFH